MTANADISAYSQREIRRAVNLSAILGWFCVIGAPMLFDLFQSGWDATLWSLFQLLTLFGVPSAFLIAWIFVAPALRKMMRKPVTFFRAAYWGGAISTGLVLLSIAIGRLRGWHQSHNDNFDSQIGGGDFVRSVDGILTPYGWQILARNSLLFIAVCIFVAVVIRAIVGPGKSVRPAEVKQ